MLESETPESIAAFMAAADRVLERSERFQVDGRAEKAFYLVEMVDACVTIVTRRPCHHPSAS